jgi:HD-like signal output (HDOD) protein
MKFWQPPQEVLPVITHHYTQNIDLRMLKQFCLIAELHMGSLFLEENRAKEAIVALDSPY